MLDFEASWLDLLRVSASFNGRHGGRLKEAHKRQAARTVARADPGAKHTEEAIAATLGVAQQTVHDWISDIRARQRASQESVIIRLSRLGWTQAEIAAAVGMKQGRISEIIGNTGIGNFDNLLAEGRDMDYIADLHSMDLALA